YTTSHTYDSYGRPLNTTYPSAFVLTRAYNSQGYLSQLKDGATAIQTINDLDAFGNSIDESYANGVDTLRTYDPETGRLTDVNTIKGGTTFQNNDYAWRSNGTLESRIANPAQGLSTTRKESYVYDVLNRVTLAETYINGSNTRDLAYTYNLLGNINSKTSTLTGDTDVTGYSYGAGAAGPHAVTSASVDGIAHTLTYDSNGAVTKYDISGTSDDKYIAYNAFNLPTKIVIGDSLTDTSPEAMDEFAYGPNGQRYSRKTTWKEGGNTFYEVVYYIGPVEIVIDNAVVNIQTVTKTTLSPNVMHVKMQGTTTDSFFEYAHRDHLGSIEAVTDENGNKLDNLAFEPFGSRKKKDWTANISASEFSDLIELDWGHSRKVRGFTGHEHLDRTGFIHMNGRIYDPTLGRFLSPDPFVQFPTSTQSWNRYSYVRNSPASFTDSSGYSEEEIPNIIVLPDEPSGGLRVPASAYLTTATGALGIMTGGSFPTSYQGTNNSDSPAIGTSDEVIEEIVAVGQRAVPVTHFGFGSAYVSMGGVNSFHLFAVFDSNGGTTVVASQQGRASASRVRQPASRSAGLSHLLVGVNLSFLWAGYSDGLLPGFWRGVNGKWNSLGWGGNKWTGPRVDVTFHTRHLNLIAKGIVVLDVGTESVDLFNAVRSGDRLGALDSIVDFGAIGIGLSGNPYAAWGAAWYGITDATFGPLAANWVAGGLCKLDSACL
ncbi:MAG TPA: RHS repeat-associated core domain-containing protein, partial [Woeseiaceae bacterium]|nr:RHS repeat-associated core domain-containing protein [Woeseiaceae bacterium]